MAIYPFVSSEVKASLKVGLPLDGLRRFCLRLAWHGAPGSPAPWLSSLPPSLLHGLVEVPGVEHCALQPGTLSVLGFVRFLLETHGHVAFRIL